MTADLIRALEFYSDPANYKAPFTGGMGALYFDCGAKAREALAAHRAQAPAEGALDVCAAAEQAMQAYGEAIGPAWHFSHDAEVMLTPYVKLAIESAVAAALAARPGITPQSGNTAAAQASVITSESAAPAEGDAPSDLDWLDLPGAVAAWNRIRRAARALNPTGSIAEALNAAAALADLAFNVQPKGTAESWPCPKCGVERGIFPACAQDGCPLMVNGLTEAETAQTASVMGLTQSPAPAPEPVAEVVVHAGNGRELVWTQTFGAWDIPEPGTKLYAQGPAVPHGKEEQQ